MFAISSGRAGNFGELGLASDEQEVAAIAASGRTPLEVVLPDSSSGEHWGGESKVASIPCLLCKLLPACLPSPPCGLPVEQIACLPT